VISFSVQPGNKLIYRFWKTNFSLFTRLRNNKLCRNKLHWATKKIVG